MDAGAVGVRGESVVVDTESMGARGGHFLPMGTEGVQATTAARCTDEKCGVVARNSLIGLLPLYPLTRLGTDPKLNIFTKAVVFIPRLISSMIVNAITGYFILSRLGGAFFQRVIDDTVERTINYEFKSLQEDAGTIIGDLSLAMVLIVYAVTLAGLLIGGICQVVISMFGFNMVGSEKTPPGLLSLEDGKDKEPLLS